MIKLQCVCGNVLSLPEHLDGKQVRCKRCNKILKVHKSGTPAHVRAPDELTESQRGRVIDQDLVVQGSRPCPGCGKTYPPAIVVCTECGLNVDSGAMLYASLDDAAGTPKREERPPAPKGLWERLLSKLGLGRKG